MVLAVAAAETAQHQAEAAFSRTRDGLPSGGADDDEPLHRAFRARQEQQYRQMLGVDIRADALRLMFEEIGRAHV